MAFCWSSCGLPEVLARRTAEGDGTIVPGGGFKNVDESPEFISA